MKEFRQLITGEQFLYIVDPLCHDEWVILLIMSEFYIAGNVSHFDTT